MIQDNRVRNGDYTNSNGQRVNVFGGIIDRYMARPNDVVGDFELGLIYDAEGNVRNFNELIPDGSNIRALSNAEFDAACVI